MNPPRPAAFIGHGNPMNALETNRYTEAWRLFGATVPRPRAILVKQVVETLVDVGHKELKRSGVFVVSAYRRRRSRPSSR